MKAHILMFKPGFVDAIRTGKKFRTIRPPRKREIRVGDILDLRIWRGRPYHSKQETFLITICEAAIQVRITENGFNIRHFTESDDTIAQSLGFACWEEARNWYIHTHGELPFEGVMYEW